MTTAVRGVAAADIGAVEVRAGTPAAPGPAVTPWPARRGARRGPAAAALVALGVGLLLPDLLGAGSLYLFSAAIADAVAVLSIVLLTGLAGQLSLAQAAFMGVGALVAAHLGHDLGVPAGLAMVGGAIAAVPVGMVAAVPALRVGGIQLAVITLAYGQLLEEVFFKAPGNGGSGGVPMPRPAGLAGDVAFCRLEVVVLAAAAAALVALRGRRTGRNLALLRESESAALAVGVDVVRTKLAVFALSALLAGAAGALLAGVSGQATPESYSPFDSIGLLAVAVIGGVGSVAGAVAAGLLRACGASWISHLPLGAAPPDLASVVFGAGLVVTLVTQPDGMAAPLRSLDRAVRRLRGRGPAADASEAAG